MIQLYIEHMKLYRSFREGFLKKNTKLTLEKPMLKEGNDITLISYGAMVQESLKAAEELEKDGYSVEVIDLRTVQQLI